MRVASFSVFCIQKSSFPIPSTPPFQFRADALYLGTPLTTLDNNSGISDFCHRDVDALVRYNASALSVRRLYRRVVLRLPELVVEEDYREAIPTALWITCSVFIGGVKDEVAFVIVVVPFEAKAKEWIRSPWSIVLMLCL